MSKEIKKSELENLVKSMLSEEVKKRQIQKRLDEVNSQLNEMMNPEDYINFETEWEDVYVPKEMADVLSQYVDNVEIEDDHAYGEGFEVGLEVETKITGSYSPATWGYYGGSPEEYPDYEYEIKGVFVKNQKTGKWEMVGSEDGSKINKEHPFVKNLESHGVNSWETLDNVMRKEYGDYIDEDESLWDKDPY